MKLNNRIPLTLLACCVLAATTSSCGKRKGGPPVRPPAGVKTAIAVQTNTPIIIQAFGNTRERVSVDIVPQVSGILIKTLVRDGDTVTNGQPLFLIDPSDYAARVRQAEGVVKADRANLELSRGTLERNRAMFEKKLISEETFDSLKTRVSAIEGQLQMDEAMLEQARLGLARCTVSSPLAGICSKRYVDEGNLVAAGISKLTNIRSYDPMIIEYSISEQYLPAIRLAMSESAIRLDIVPRGSTNRFSGAVTFIDNAVNTMTGSIMLRGEVPNRELKIWSGQFVDIIMSSGFVRDAVMVPEGAVQFGKRGPYLYVVKDGKADMRPVKTGIRFGQLIQIEEGVASGDVVVVLGQLMLFPGAPVAEVQQQPAAGTGGKSNDASAGGKGMTQAVTNAPGR
ncbi:MAG: efflux RND transporter periplasmic adaptor subunit [bacterium]